MYELLVAYIKACSLNLPGVLNLDARKASPATQNGWKDIKTGGGGVIKIAMEQELWVNKSFLVLVQCSHLLPEGCLQGLETKAVWTSGSQLQVTEPHLVRYQHG